MRLSEQLAPHVSARTRARGAAYAAAGAVTQMEDHDGVVHAVVRGRDNYNVWLEPAAPVLRSSCTCPYFTDRVEICKHVWAAILEAEDRGLLRDAARSRLTDISLQATADDLIDDQVPEHEARPPARTQRPPPPVPAAALPRTAGEARPGGRTPPVWRQMLDEVAAAAEPPPIVPPRLLGGQFLFAIDVEASRAARTLVMELMTRDRKTSGEWGRPRAARVSNIDVRHLPAGRDRDILERLLGARADYGTLDTFAGEVARFRLDGTLVPELLPLMCADGRCVARIANGGRGGADATVGDADLPSPVGYRRPAKSKGAPALLPLTFDAGEAWRFEPQIRRDERTRTYQIEGAFTRAGERMAVTEPLLVLADGILITRTHVATLDHRDAFAWIAAMRRAGGVAIPFEGRPALIDALLAQPLPVNDPPEDLRLRIEQGIAQPSLRLVSAHWRGRLEAELTIAYGDLRVGINAPNTILRTADAARIIRRDLEAERGFLDTLHRLGFRREWSPRAQAAVLQIASERLPRVVRTLLAGGWHVEASGIVYRRPGTVGLSVSSGIDWFELEGSVDYEGQQVALPALLAAARRGDTFVTLGDGTQGLLPEEWLTRHGALARMGSVEGTRLRFKPSQVALLDALLAEQPAVSCDETFARARQELASFTGIAPVDPPPDFTGTLRGYQREGLGWLLFLRRFGFGGCLADDMGLGKTVMVLALLAHVRGDRAAGDRRPSLVVAPRSLVFNWRQEAARFTPALRVLEYTGMGRTALRETLDVHDLVLTTYGTVRRDAAYLAAVPFEYVVLDEAQAIKNASSASAKAARVLDARHRLALSGTPIENHLGELWSLFEFLNPGVLGSAAAFGAGGPGKLDEEAVALLARGLRPFMLRRTKDQVAPELPAKTEQTVYCELKRPQRALYDELRDHYRRTLLGDSHATGKGGGKLQVLEALLRLRQAACHPGLIDSRRKTEPSAKLEVLVPHVLQALEEGHKTLVFSQFTSLLGILRSALDAAGVSYEYLDGRTRDRQARIERFQTDADCRLFLISLKAGGVGLNLTAAEYVFLLDPWWNPAVEAQAIDRTHRIGQSRHVFAYRLIARDTVEERVLELQQRKRTLADAILAADESLLRTLRREDLELLLS